MTTENVAILVDGGFYQRRAKHFWGDRKASDRANELINYCHEHLFHKVNGSIMYDRLYRIFYYDCPPAQDSVFSPLLNKTVSLKNSELFTFMSEFHSEILKKRKVALRLGKLSSNDLHYMLTYDAQKKILSGEKRIDELTELDFQLNITQKGVDMRIGLDIAAMAYKKLVTRIVLISGDSDFVPAAKLARREGIDFILDAMDKSISRDLSEHIDGLQSFTRRDPLCIRQARM